MPLKSVSLANIPDVPGVYALQDQYGAIPANIRGMKNVYMFGYSATSSNYAPQFVNSPEDFFNLYGASASANSVSFFFRQRSGFGLTFINVPPKKVNTVAIATVTAGTTYTVTIDSYPVSVVASATDTPTTVITKLRTTINDTLSHIARMTGNNIRTRTATTVVGSTGVTVTTTNAAATPTAQDVADHAFTTLNAVMLPGFIIAPEFYQQIPLVADRLTLYNGLEEAANILNWIHFADCGQEIATSVTGAGAINLAIAEHSAHSSPRGASYYYFPYVVDGADNLVPLSAGVVGLYLRRARQQGLQEPPAGSEFPLYGVKRLSFEVDDYIQEQLNSRNINCGRSLPFKGIVMYGARSCSANLLYRPFTSRVVLNALIHTLVPALDSLVFSTISGTIGGKMLTAKQTAGDVLQDFYNSGMLFGDTPQESYLVICDGSNNPKSLLQQGGLAVDVVVKPAGMTERVILRVTNTALGVKLEEIVDSADTTENKSPANPTTPTTGSPKAQ